MAEDERKVDYGPAARGKHRTILRENWYRDVWLLLITLFMVFAVLQGINENSERINDQQRSRYESILTTCLEDNARNLRAHARADALAKSDGVSEQGAIVIETMVDAMVPFTKDCEDVARGRVTPPPLPSG